MAEIKLHRASMRDVTSCDGVIIVEPANVYECTLGAGVFIGPFCEVQKGVIVGARTRVQSHSFICELVTIGEDCFIGHGVMFINDRFAGGAPARGDTSKWEITKVGNRVSIGSNATIMPVTICDDVVIGAGSVVTKSIIRAGVYAGNPARLLREHH
jgi:acetyltransferase-like isoleucine patch superfamily enzyme